MSPQPNVAGFVPVHGGHAVEQAILAVHFGSELTDPQLHDLRGDMGTLSELPKRATLRGVTFAIGPGAVTQHPGQAEAVLGIVMTRHNSNGEIEAELQLQRGAIIYRTTKYPGWANLSTFFRDQVLARALPRYLESASTSSYVMGYTDKFVSDPLDLASSVFDLLRPRSRFICPYIYEQLDYWHSHSGAFQRIEQGTQRLVNVNVDYRPERTDDAQRRAVALSIALTDTLNSGSHAPAAPQNLEMIAAKLDRMHTDTKLLVGEVLADGVIQSIALFG